MSRRQIYVDESGDRIRGVDQSEVYVLSAAIVREEERAELVAALGGIATALGKPPGTVLQWSRNLRRPSQRLAATTLLAAAPLRLTSVVMLKRAMRWNDPSAPHRAVLRL